jgi:hypothetical protein
MKAQLAEGNRRILLDDNTGDWSVVLRPIEFQSSGIFISVSHPSTLYTHTHTHTHTYIYMHIYIHTYLHVCIYIYTHTHICIYIYTHIYIYIYVCIWPHAYSVPTFAKFDLPHKLSET